MTLRHAEADADAGKEMRRDARRGTRLGHGDSVGDAAPNKAIDLSPQERRFFTVEPIPSGEVIASVR